MVRTSLPVSRSYEEMEAACFFPETGGEIGVEGAGKAGFVALPGKGGVGKPFATGRNNRQNAFINGNLPRYSCTKYTKEENLQLEGEKQHLHIKCLKYRHLSSNYLTLFPFFMEEDNSLPAFYPVFQEKNAGFGV